MIGEAGNDSLHGGKGMDLLADGAGSDTVIGDSEADTIELSIDKEGDLLLYNSFLDAGDSITGFDPAAPPVGDVIDIDALLPAAVVSFTDAVKDGFLDFAGTGAGGTEILVDTNGGGNSFLTLATLLDIAFTSSKDSQALLEDNIVV